MSISAFIDVNNNINKNGNKTKDTNTIKRHKNKEANDKHEA